MGAIPHKAVINRFLPTGENKTSEAPGVVFDPTIGEEGVETPLPNDSFKASNSPPVGGRLRSFSRDWQANNCSSNVLNIITNGYVLPFLSKPNLDRFPLIISEYKALPKDQALADCIQSLLSNNAIERVENVKSQLFTDASNEGWGAHLEQSSTQGLWSPQEKGLHINVQELKAVFLALRHFKDQCQDQTVLVATDNSTVVAYINKQGGTHSAEMCALLWRIMTWCHHSHINIESQAHSRVPECDGRPTFQVASGTVDRMVTTSTGVQTDLPKVVHSPHGPICHSSEPQASTVRVSYPRPEGLGHRCSKHRLDGSHCLCLPSNGSPSQGDPKNQTMQLSDHTNSPRLARDALVIDNA